jgi:hypothetical protein
MRESVEKGAEKPKLQTLFSRKSNPKGQGIPE